MSGLRRLLFSGFWMVLLLAGLSSQPATSMAASQDHEKNIHPAPLTSRQVDDKEWVTDRTGASVDLGVKFVDENGKKVDLAGLVDKPTILLPIYFYCPNICGQTLANLAQALPRMSARPGKDYRVVAVSFNHRENAETAARAKENYLQLAGEDFPADQWSFLTGDKESIRLLMEQIGFRFQALDDLTFLHPSALVVLDKKGTISRYVYGSFLPGDIELGIQGAARGETLQPVRRLLNFCFNYDPAANQFLFKAAKFGILVVFLLVAGGIVYFTRRRGKNRPQ